MDKVIKDNNSNERFFKDFLRKIRRKLFFWWIFFVVISAGLVYLFAIRAENKAFGWSLGVLSFIVTSALIIVTYRMLKEELKGRFGIQE